LQATVANLTSQLEEAESQLEQERSSRQSSQSSQDTKIKEIEASWNAVLKEKQDNWDAREKSLEGKVENQDRLLKELKASYEVSQRMDKAEDDSSNTLGASQQELDLVNQELEKANLRLSELQGRNEQLRLDLAQSTANQSSSQTAVSVEDDPSFLRLRSENSQLLRKLDSQRYEKDSEKSKWDSSIRSLERELDSLKQDRESLKRKLDKCSDYDEVKQELDMLKVCSFLNHNVQVSTNRHSQSSLRQATPTIQIMRQTQLLVPRRASLWKSCSSPETRSSPTSSPFSEYRTTISSPVSSRCKKNSRAQTWSWRNRAISHRRSRRICCKPRMRPAMPLTPRPCQWQAHTPRATQSPLTLPRCAEEATPRPPLPSSLASILAFHPQGVWTHFVRKLLMLASCQWSLLNAIASRQRFVSWRRISKTSTHWCLPCAPRLQACKRTI